MKRRLVLYAVGSPLVIEFEESCGRCGIEIAAGIRNVPGESFASDAVAIVAPEEATLEVRRLGIALPLFTPANRCAAYEDARRHGFSTVETIIDPTAIVAVSALLGSGVYLNAAVVIGGGAVLGNLVLVNRGASIGHHARIDDFASIGPGAVLAGGFTSAPARWSVPEP